VFRRFGHDYRQAGTGHLSLGQMKVMAPIEKWRTASLGGHVDACDDCGTLRVSYNSCGNRHCPKCQGLAAEDWLADRQAELLPVPSCHLIFTVQPPVAMIAYRNKPIVSNIRFKTPAATLLAIAGDPNQYHRGPCRSSHRSVPS